MKSSAAFANRIGASALIICEQKQHDLLQDEYASVHLYAEKPFHVIRLSENGGAGVP